MAVCFGGLAQSSIRVESEEKRGEECIVLASPH